MSWAVFHVSRKNTEVGNTSACYACPTMTKQMYSSMVCDRTVTQHPLSLSKQTYVQI